jgi:hypothetical protein
MIIHLITIKVDSGTWVSALLAFRLKQELTLEFEFKRVSCALSIGRSLLIEVWAGLLCPIPRKGDVSISIVQCRIGQGSTGISDICFENTSSHSLSAPCVHTKFDQIEQQVVPFIGDFNSMGRECQCVGQIQDIPAGLISTASDGLIVRLLRRGVDGDSVASSGSVYSNI